MWSRTYREHFIMAFPSFDAATRKWRAQADISWSAGDRRDSAFVRYPRHAETEVQAVNVALRQSLKWVDGRIVSGRTNTSIGAPRIRCSATFTACTSVNPFETLPQS